MTRFSLHSEPYGTTGNIGENFLRLLGSPSLSQLQTVIREAVQNIADAAKLGSGPEILIRIRKLKEDETTCFREQLLAELPEESTSKESLRRFLDSPEPVVLEICDFGTSGLGGPTRADRIPVGTKRTDFINFLRNIGTPRDTDHGGGTYGFGKAALYAVSRCKTIFVDTLVGYGSDPERRLIGCHVGARFEIAEDGMKRQFTGRHWWGVPDSLDQIADPARGEQAVTLAEAVGFPDRSSGRSGTSIMILDFETEDEDIQTIGQRIVEGLLWSFWPRMMRDAPTAKKFSCKVMVGDEEIPIPAPEEFAPLDLFCKAMRAARAGEGNDVRPIGCQKPIRDLGTLAIEKGLRGARHPVVGEGSLFPSISHHIALMRPVELIVRYMKGTPLPDERLEWAGVFLVANDDDVERAFAYSEPPAHDDWIPGNMEKGHPRTFVNVALKRLEAHAHEMGETGFGKPGGVSDAPPLARVAGKLGAALSGVTGDGAGETRGGGGGGGGGAVRRAKATRPVFERLTREGGITLAVFSTELRQDANHSGNLLRAEASVAMEGGASGKLDASIEPPEVLSIKAVDGSLSNDGGMIVVDGAEGRFEIFVSVPADCAVIVDAQLQSEEMA